MFTELVHSALSDAIHGKLVGTEEDFYRRVCRFYSKNFHTPLEEVFRLAPQTVLTAYYEEFVDKYDLDVESDVKDLLERVYTLIDPNYEQAKEVELDNFIAKVEQKNQELLNKKNEIKNSPNEPKASSSKNSLLEPILISYLILIES